MSYQVLARKWRPKSFETLVGQPHVVRALSNALEQQRLHHAYLFTGTRGVGKTTLARILAKSLNCETGITAKPCGVCSACTEIDKGRFIDLIEVDAASNTQVDAMRELLENAQYAPTSGRFKVYIIDEVHMLSKSAFNAMLKTLEEPPAHVKFILATTDPQKVPVTILSRCLQFNLRQMAAPTVAEHLQHVLSEEKIPFELAAIQLIARAAAGSMRDALSLTDQAIAYGNQSVQEAEVRSMLGAIDQSYLYDIINALIKADGAALVEKANQMEARSISFEGALNDLAQMLHQIAMMQTVPDSVSADTPDHAALAALAQQLSAEKLQLYYQIALLGRRDIGLAPDEYAGFTMTLLRMLAFAPMEKISTGETAPPNSASRAPDQSAPTTPAVTKPIGATAAPAPPVDTATDIARQETRTDDLTERSFDGNWRNLVERHLKLGLARALAQNCELVSYDEFNMTLRVPQSQKHLASPTYQEKLSGAINDYFGRKIRLNIQIDAEANTPAMQKTAEKAELQSHAEAAILQDGFVKDLMEKFDAQIIPNTIKPV
jgi:DNA polymerase III subunit gamma/tau